MLDTLEKRRLVRRMPHPDDRRKLRVAITDEGADIVDQLLPSLHARERTIINAALSKAEQRQLRTMLAKVQQAAIIHAEDQPDRSSGRVRPRPAAARGRR